MSGRCKACDCVLSDFEMTRKIKSDITGKKEYVELCNTCFSSTDTDEFVYERDDLLEEKEH